MKYLFASDIHGSAYYCRKLLDAFREEQAERLVLLGDLLYHGPRNDLPREYAPKEVIAMLLFSMNIKTKFTLSAETARPRLTRWFWNFR